MNNQKNGCFKNGGEHKSREIEESIIDKTPAAAGSELTQAVTTGVTEYSS